MDLKKSLECFLDRFKLDRNVPAVLSAHAPCYVVGGWIRDALVGHTSADIDLVMENPAEAAKHLGNSLRGRVICLDEEHQIYRIVLHRLGMTIDLAQLYHHDIIEDLKHRDLTVNAMAFDLLRPESILDPFHGARDLEQGIIRTVGPNSLAEDPLRVFRVFRFAARLGFIIDPPVFNRIRAIRTALPSIAGERIVYELSLFLSGPNPCPYLAPFLESDILPAILGRHSSEFPTPDMASFCNLAVAILEPPPLPGFSPARDILIPDRYFHDGARLLLLIHLFFGYYQHLMNDLISKLKINSFLNHRLKQAGRFLQKLDECPDTRSIQELALELIADYGNWIMLLIYYRYLHQRALPDHDSRWESVLRLYQTEWKSNLNLSLPLNGEILHRDYALKPGPIFKTILRQLKIDMIRGKIRNRTEADRLVRQIIETNPLAN
ncbi:MAG: CCA tRNA nucleotidyltransferase [Candidatus Delongbacteria bacterium]|nr:CCA tRNA nucleotidyltransferase [Candidatus Delongbacteria bacterium]